MVPGIVFGQYQKEADADFANLNRAADQVKQASAAEVFRQMPVDNLSGVNPGEAMKNAASSRQASLDQIKTAKEKTDGLAAELNKPAPRIPQWPLLGNQEATAADSALREYRKTLSDYRTEFQGVTELFEAKYQGWLAAAQNSQKAFEALAAKNAQGYLSAVQGLADAAKQEGDDIKAIKPVSSDGALLTVLAPQEERNSQLANQIATFLKARQPSQAAALLPQVQQNDNAINAEFRKYLPALQERSKFAELSKQLLTLRKKTEDALSGIK